MRDAGVGLGCAAQLTSLVGRRALGHKAPNAIRREIEPHADPLLSEDEALRLSWCVRTGARVVEVGGRGAIGPNAQAAAGQLDTRAL